MRLNQAQTMDYIEKLADQLTKKQADSIEAVAKLLDGSAMANLGQVLSVVFPGKSNEDTLNSLRVLRKQINDAAKTCNIEFEFCVDSEKRKSPDQRTCWLEGLDLSTEKMERMVGGLLRNNPQYQPKDYTPPLGRSQFRIFVSSSDNRDAEIPTDKGREDLEDFLRRLRLTFKAKRRGDLADGIYHFREQQDNLMQQRIVAALDACEVGLLLISKPYLASNFVTTMELPRFNPVCFHAGKPGYKDSVPLLFSHCFNNDPVEINNNIGFSKEGGLQILRFKDKHSFTECNDGEKESFIESIAERLCSKLPLDYAPGEHSRRSHLDIFTHGLRDKLNNDCNYRPLEWEPPLGECCPMGRVASPPQPKPETCEEQPKGFDALERLTAWASTPDSAHVHALLGDLGSGKTFTCRMLALKLLQKRMDGNNTIPLPIYIDLREVGFASQWNGAPTLDNILEGWLRHWQLGVTPDEEHKLDVAAIKRLSLAGAVWIFDGFDEISSHLPRNGDNAFFKELLRPVAPHEGNPSKSKVLVSCRSHYFPTLAKQNATLLEEARGVLRPGTARPDSEESTELICDNTLLLPFDEEQIKNYLARTLGETQAERAVEVIAGIHDLSELSRQPYLLRMIREQIAQLELMKSQGKPVNAASLYGLFVADWLQRDEGKHTIEPEDKLRLMERLAAQMWSERQRGWSFELLQRWVHGQMESEPDWRFRYQTQADLIAKDLHTASFIVRFGESNFRFIHTSMQEYFVAAHLLRGLREQSLELWNLVGVSRETLSFLADLWRLCPEHEHPALYQVQRQLHTKPPSPDAALLALDYLLAARQKGWPHILPDKLDLSGTDIGQRTLCGQPTQPWCIDTLRLTEVNAPQIRMSYLTIRHLEARCARLAGSRWQHCIIETAHLDSANLAGAQIRNCIWHAVSLVQADLRYTELRLSQFDVMANTDTSEIIGPVWWMAPNPTPPWAIMPQACSPALPVFVARAGHYQMVNSVTWRSDGKQLASAGWDSTVRIWDVESGACLMTLRGHESQINSVAWRGDGKQLASAGWDSTVRIWDAESGACLMTLQGHESQIRSVTWRGDGKQLASAGWDNTVRIWDAESGACLMTLQGHESLISSVAWRGDGKQLASAGDDSTVRIWDAESGACLMTLQGHESLISSVTWRGDGKQLASAGDDSTIRIWDAESGACLMTLQGHESPISSVTWRGDGKQLASAGWDDMVRIWDADSGACLMTLQGHKSPISSVTWRGDGKQLASAGWDDMVRIWDADSGACLMTLQGNESAISSVAWRGDGKKLASAGDGNTVRILDAGSGTCLMTLRGHERPISSVAWRSDGKQLASAGYDNTVRIWDAESGACLMTLQGHERLISSVAWRSDGKQLASAGWDDMVRIWDADSSACLMTLQGHERPISSVAWRGDGKQLASAGWDKTVRIWDADSGACLMTLQGHESPINSVTWRGDGKQLASAGDGNTVRIWDTDSGACLMALQGHESPISSVAWRGDGKQLASAGWDNMVRIWDASSGACIKTLEGHESAINSVAWRSDGQQLASAGYGGTIRIWDATSGLLVYQCMAIGEAEALLNDRNEVIRANDAAWPYLARMGNNPVTGERMWIPAEVDEIGK